MPREVTADRPNLHYRTLLLIVNCCPVHLIVGQSRLCGKYIDAKLAANNHRDYNQPVIEETPHYDLALTAYLRHAPISSDAIPGRNTAAPSGSRPSVSRAPRPAIRSYVGAVTSGCRGHGAGETRRAKSLAGKGVMGGHNSGPRLGIHCRVLAGSPVRKQFGIEMQTATLLLSSQTSPLPSWLLAQVRGMVETSGLKAPSPLPTLPKPVRVGHPALGHR